eukprot:SAG11_NODE_1988_length_3961_cov_2.373900_4_plen_86_part_00
MTPLFLSPAAGQQHAARVRWLKIWELLKSELAGVSVRWDLLYLGRNRHGACVLQQGDTIRQSLVGLSHTHAVLVPLCSSCTSHDA